MIIFTLVKRLTPSQEEIIVVRYNDRIHLCPNYSFEFNLQYFLILFFLTKHLKFGFYVR